MPSSPLLKSRGKKEEYKEIKVFLHENIIQHRALFLFIIFHQYKGSSFCILLFWGHASIQKVPMGYIL